MAHQKALVTEKLEAVGMMTSSVAHDFSNLLAATSAGVYLLRKRGPEEALLSGIEEAVERGKALTHRSEEHTSELQSLMRISYAVFCLKKKKNNRSNADYS